MSETAPESYELGEFLDYLTINYIDSSSYLFPIDYWNHYDNPGARTNNYLEGYNLKMEKYINAKPNIWKFIIKIKTEETEASLKFVRLNNDSFRPPRRNKDALERDNNILKLKCLFLENKIDINEYLNLLILNVHDFKQKTK